MAPKKGDSDAPGPSKWYVADRVSALPLEAIQAEE